MNDKAKAYLFNFSAILLLAGAVLYLTKWDIAPYLFAVGAAGVALNHFTTPMKDMEFRERRLQRYNILAGVLMIASSTFMFMHRTEWILCLTIAAIFQTYAVFIMSGNKKKE